MASSDNETSRRQAQEEATNPFIAFRRFADDQMANLLSGLFGLSTSLGSSSSSPSSNRALQDYQAWLQESRLSQQGLEREAEEAGRIMDVYTTAHKDSAQEEIQKAIQDADEPPRCPYRPADQVVPQRENRPEPSLCCLGSNLPLAILAAPVLGEQLSSVPVAYLLYSPYSPVRLETQGATRGLRWRDAFADLLAVQNGEDISSQCEQEGSVSNAQWVRQMIGLAMCKRDQDRTEQALHSTYEATSSDLQVLASFPATRQPMDDADDGEESQSDEFDDDDDQVTELDLYKHFLGKQGNSSNEDEYTEETSLIEKSTAASQSQSRSYAHLQHDISPTEKDGNKPSILSTLTTTERTTLEDGTTHTKVVLKKRFSDGREESTETVHTQNPLPLAQSQPVTKAIKDQKTTRDASEAGRNEQKSKGWFWS